MAGVLPIGQLDQRDLLGSLSAEELISRTLEIVRTADETLRQMMQQEPGEEPKGDQNSQ